MASLIDIADVSRIVLIGTNEVKVRGISAKDIANLLVKYPELRRAFSGVNFSVELILTDFPYIVGSIIAAGCGGGDDPLMEEAANRLPVGAQTELLAAITELTVPGGFGPFVVAVETIANSIGLSGKGPDMNSPKQSTS